jgi:N-dimethylarginine dimethylaminohydrolase
MTETADSTRFEGSPFTPWSPALSEVVLCTPETAFRSEERIASQWRALGYLDRPDLAGAITEHRAYADMLARIGILTHFLETTEDCTLDVLYSRDAVVMTPSGAILCRMGKKARSAEPGAASAFLHRMNIPIVGRIEGPGSLEGGDVVWLNERSVAVGIGYRSDHSGARQLSRLLGADIQVVPVDLPHWNGPEDVLHLMSLLSPIDRNSFVAYSRLLPVSFRQHLLSLGAKIIEIDEAEFDTLACNVLAVAPLHCVMKTGNPRTQSALEQAGFRVSVFRGQEICIKGQGGPTCLTLPIRWKR